MGSMQFPGIWFSVAHPDLVVLFHVLCSVLLLQFTFTVCYNNVYTDKKIVPEVEEGELVLEHPNNIWNWSDDTKQWPSIVYGDIYTYLIDSKTVDGKRVKSWKSFNSLNYWLNGWVVSCNI